MLADYKILSSISLLNFGRILLQPLILVEYYFSHFSPVNGNPSIPPGLSRGPPQYTFISIFFRCCEPIRESSIICQRHILSLSFNINYKTFSIYSKYKNYNFSPHNYIYSPHITYKHTQSLSFRTQTNEKTKDKTHPHYKISTQL